MVQPSVRETGQTFPFFFKSGDRKFALLLRFVDTFQALVLCYLTKTWLGQKSKNRVFLCTTSMIHELLENWVFLKFGDFKERMTFFQLFWLSFWGKNFLGNFVIKFLGKNWVSEDFCDLIFFENLELQKTQFLAKTWFQNP